MIIYGTRMYGRKNEVRSHGRCAHCGKVGTQKSYDGRKWGHLYFIPLIPDGGRVRVLRECASCHKGYHIPVDKVPALVESIRKTFDDTVVAIGARETEVTLDGKTHPVLAALDSNLSDGFCLAGEHEIVHLLDHLHAIKADEELHFVEAKFAELRGDLRLAETRFGELVARTSQPLILFQAARFFHHHGRNADALALATRLESLRPADLEVKQLLIDCHTANQDWAGVAATYENCFLVSPALRDDKAVAKAYRKACKKSGHEPRP